MSRRRNSPKHSDESVDSPLPSRSSSLLDDDAFSDLNSVAADVPIPAGDEPSSGEATCGGRRAQGEGSTPTGVDGNSR